METKKATEAPVRGDVIWVRRSPFHFHCGIYESDDIVYHFAPTDGSKTKEKEKAVIHPSSLADFAMGSSVQVKRFPREKCLPVEETIKQAREHLGKSGYDLFSNNCDHFATLCKTGERRSLQVEFAIKAVIGVGTACIIIFIKPIKRMLNPRNSQKASV